jgi:hypothetical protein
MYYTYMDTNQKQTEQIAELAAKYNAKLVDTTVIETANKGAVGTHYTYVATLNGRPVLIRMIATPDGRILSNQLGTLNGKTAAQYTQEA